MRRDKSCPQFQSRMPTTEDSGCKPSWTFVCPPLNCAPWREDNTSAATAAANNNKNRNGRSSSADYDATRRRRRRRWWQSPCPQRAAFKPLILQNGRVTKHVWNIGRRTFRTKMKGSYNNPQPCSSTPLSLLHPIHKSTHTCTLYQRGRRFPPPNIVTYPICFNKHMHRRHTSTHRTRKCMYVCTFIYVCLCVYFA